jgi:hypothetical protein
MYSFEISTPIAVDIGATNRATITLDGDKTVNATFTQDGPLPAIKVTIAPDLATIPVGQSITYTATAKDAQGHTWDVTAETDLAVESGAEGPGQATSTSVAR